VRDLHAWYDESHILHGIDFDVRPGEVVTLLGRNGAGKTTTLKSVMGTRLGIAFCPEERGIFASLNVSENLTLPPVVRPGGLSLETIFGLFPNLRERLRSQGTKLSGGEQQMLAIGRILRTGARLLLLDEPTEGLAPVIVQQIGATIKRLKGEGFTIHREAMWEAFGRCPEGAAGTSCRTAERERFEAEWEGQRARIEAKYRGVLSDFERRCRAILSRASLEPPTAAS